MQPPSSQNTNVEMKDGGLEEEKKEEFVGEENEEMTPECEADGDGDGDGWGDDGDGEGWGDDGDEGGWDDYGEEEEDEVVKQALEQTRKKKELESKIEEIRITFKPRNFRDGMIARIMGDFTEWIPVTM